MANDPKLRTLDELLRAVDQLTFERDSLLGQRDMLMRTLAQPAPPSIGVREFFAGLAMQALLNRSDAVERGHFSIVESAVDAADTLLAKLNKG